jgi:hypothetical protein
MEPQVRNRFVASLLAAMLVAGCGALGNRLGPEKIGASDFSQDSALVVLSAGAPERCMMAATFLRIYPSGAPFNLTSVITSFNVDGYAVQSDFTTHQGSLSVLKLKPGSYYLAPAIANPNTRALRIPKADFSVAAGEIVYLGEYWMPVSCAFNTRSGFRDQEARDMALLKQKNTAFANAKITKRIAAFTGYIVFDDK